MLPSSSVCRRPNANGAENWRGAVAEPGTIRDVWAANLDDEFDVIMFLVQKYTYVAIDTEFPGLLVRPDNNELRPSHYQYALVRDNVNRLKLNGEPAPDCSTWQFNFKFSVTEDEHGDDAIPFLTEHGIQLDKHERDGIDPNEFAQRCTTSGVVLSDSVKCLCFYGPYDFAYLLKVLTGQNLPQEESDFFELIRLYFPVIYDIKCIMPSCPGLRGGLQSVANALGVQRVGPEHQAGSDSMLTGAVFFKMREVYFGGEMDDRYCGQISGLGGVNFILYGSTWYGTEPVSISDVQEGPKDADAEDCSWAEPRTQLRTRCGPFDAHAESPERGPQVLLYATFQAIAGVKFWAHGFVLAARHARCAAFFSSCYGRLSFVVESMPVQQGNAWPPVCDVVVSGLSSEMLELLIDLAYNIPINEREGLHNVREVLDVAESLNIASSTLKYGTTAFSCCGRIRKQKTASALTKWL
ncbi:hypothetical protein HPB48_003609 [Haemaphysalis longicornis]|uniref:poly(A)-specific ribonuclease n=1 Tax=Haemaphysalis longicornis TaxID=44386 RepID=A0A9J6FFS1_HAELO|nr:hypothetical protein HPB48_003609 [Haemaphysalis longicornis]